MNTHAFIIGFFNVVAILNTQKAFEELLCKRIGKAILQNTDCNRKNL